MAGSANSAYNIDGHGVIISKLDVATGQFDQIFQVSRDQSPLSCIPTKQGLEASPPHLAPLHFHGDYVLIGTMFRGDQAIGTLFPPPVKLINLCFLSLPQIFSIFSKYFLAHHQI